MKEKRIFFNLDTVYIQCTLLFSLFIIVEYTLQ